LEIQSLKAIDKKRLNDYMHNIVKRIDTYFTY